MQSISGMMSKTLGDRQKFATALKTYPWTSKHQKNCQKKLRRISLGENFTDQLQLFNSKITSGMMSKTVGIHQKFATALLISFWTLIHRTSKTGLQRPAARYDAIGKIGGGYGFLVSVVSRVVSRCSWLPKFVPCYLKWSLVA